MNLYTLNTSFEVQNIVDQYSSFIWTDRYNKAGDFELYLPMSVEIEAMFPMDWYLQNSDSSRTMIIEQHKVETSFDDGDWLTITGRSLESILDRRVVWGQTSFTNANFQDAILELLDDNIVNPSATSRKISNFTYKASSDPAITSLTLDAQYAGDNLLTVIEDACNEKLVGFKVTLNAQNQFVFELYSGVDRTYDQSTVPYVIFSPEFDNLANSEYLHSKQSYKNTVLVGGEGEGDEKKYVSYDTGATGLDRREMYHSASNTSSSVDGQTLSPSEYNAQLAQEGKEELEKNKEIVTLSGEMNTSVLYTYEQDYDCGDIVQVEDEYGHTSTSRITEMIFSHDEEGYLVYPTFEAVTEE